MGVFEHTLIIIMPGLNARGLQSKLRITPLSLFCYSAIPNNAHLIRSFQLFSYPEKFTYLDPGNFSVTKGVQIIEVLLY